MSLKLITNHKNYPLLLIDTEARITKGSYFLLRDKHINRYEGSSEERYKTHLSEPIIAASPKLGDLPELPELSEREIISLEVEDNEYKFYELGKQIFHDRPNDRDSYIDAVREGFKLCKSLYELPKQEEDAYQLAKDYTEKVKDQVIYGKAEVEWVRTLLHMQVAYRDGYKAASKKWTDEDMMEAMKQAGAIMNGSHKQFKGYTAFKDYLKSLSPTLVPIGFEPEYEEKWEQQYTGVGDSRSYQPILKLKVVNNILQGTYKFKE